MKPPNLRTSEPSSLRTAEPRCTQRLQDQVPQFLVALMSQGVAQGLQPQGGMREGTGMHLGA